MKPRLASVTSLQPNPPPLQLLRNLACDVSGLLFDLDFTHDLGPYLARHPRIKQIQEAIEVLQDQHPERAEQIQLIFSRTYDDNWQNEFGIEPQ